MTVIHPGGKSWRHGNKPPWMATPSAGFFSLAAEGNVHDCRKSRSSPGDAQACSPRLPIDLTLPLSRMNGSRTKIFRLACGSTQTTNRVQFPYLCRM
jgi:hypothetical protein